ncbi:hypothetical protein H4R35_004656 [Dimargaris xerosporica]|nr:hypothetical protein H4R35_004656 [Dimargaris xerosporica]
MAATAEPSLTAPGEPPMHASSMLGWKSLTASEFAALLVCKTWHMHRSTPWHRFQPSFGIEYSRELQAYLEQQLLPTNDYALAVLDPPPNGPWTSIHRVQLRYLTMSDSSTHQMISVTIDYTARQSEFGSHGAQQSDHHQPSDKRQQAHMIAVAASPSPTTNQDDPPRNFALVLFKGPQPLKAPLWQWFQQRFDCRFTSFRLSRALMNELALWWSEAYLDQLIDQNDHAINAVLANPDLKPIELQYAFPSTVEQLRQVTISLPLRSVVLLWKKAHQVYPALVDDRLCILDLIEHHFEQQFRIKTNRLALHTFGSGTTCVTMEGKLKFFDRAYAQFAITWLNQLSLLAQV